MLEFGLREPNSGMPPFGSLKVMRGTIEMGRPAEKAGEKPKEVASNGDEWVLKAACTKREKPRRAFKTVVGESVVVESTTTPAFFRTSGPCSSRPRPTRLL